jgi:hypothetical protein
MSGHDICSGGQYMCENHVCISSSLKCDGNKDCLEGSDENDCRKLGFCDKIDVILTSS